MIVSGALFRDALAFVSSPVSTKTAIQMLAHVRLEAGEGKLSLAATDLSVSTRAEIECGDGEIATCPKASLLQSAFASIGDGEVDLSLNGSKLVVKCGPEKYGIPCLPIAEFPTLPKPGDAKPIGTWIAFMVAEQARSGSASDDRSDASHAGTYLARNGGGVVWSSTNGHMASVVRAGAIEGAEFRAITIPSVGLGVICGLSGDGDVALALSEEPFLFVSLEGKSAAIRLRDATPYPVEKLVTEKIPKKMTAVPREALLAAIRKCVPFAGRLSGGPAVVDIKAEDGHLRIRSRDELSDAEVTAVEWDGPKDLHVVIAASYAVAALGAIHGPTVQIGWSGEGNPLILASEGQVHSIMQRRK